MKQQIISTQKLKIYQLISLLLWLGLLGIFLTIIFQSKGDQLINYYWIGYWGFGFYALFLKRTLRLRSVAFDKENLYLIEKGQEVIVPLVDIKYIKLRTALGTHSVHLFQDIGYGEVFYFKSSLWYPFNFKKVDDQVYELQKLIDKAKRNYQPHQPNALGS